MRAWLAAACIVAAPLAAHAEWKPVEELHLLGGIVTEQHGALQVVDVEVDVPDTRAGLHRRGDGIEVVQLAQQVVDIDGLAARVGRAIDRADIVAVLAIADATPPGSLEGDLDAVIVEIPQVDGLGHEVVRRRYADTPHERPNRHLGEGLAGGDVDRDVVEPERAIGKGCRGTEFEGDQFPAVDAQVQRLGILGDEFETDHVAPDAQRVVAAADADANGAEPGGERQHRRRAHGGLGFNGDHGAGS